MAEKRIPERQYAESAENAENGINALTAQIIGCAIEVHKALGPGLLESAYESCLVHELQSCAVRVERQKLLPIRYRGREIRSAYRIDLLVEEMVIVELKTVSQIEPIHEAQLLSYLRLSGNQVGLLINFNVRRLHNGIRRIVNEFSGPPLRPPRSPRPPR